VAQYEKSIQAAFREVADALAGAKRWVKNCKLNAPLREAEGARLRLSDLRYRNGTVSALDLLDAQRSLLPCNRRRCRHTCCNCRTA